MNDFKRQTLIKTISFMSLFVAINVICSFLTTLVPLISIVLIIFLPLTSAVVEVNCKDRWFPIYAFATIGLSVVVSLSSIDFTLFYIIPSIFTGYIFGLFSKRKLPSMFAIFVATSIQTVLSYLFIPLLHLITGLDVIAKIAEIIKISNIFLFRTSILLLFFLVALIQVILSFIVVDNELRKFGQKTEHKFGNTTFATYSGLITIVLSIAFCFFYLPICYLLIGISFYFAVFVVIGQSQNKNTICLILDGVSFVVGLVLYAALNHLIHGGKDFVLFLITPGLICIISMISSFLKKSPQ